MNFNRFSHPMTINSDGPLRFWDYQPLMMGIIPQNMSQTLNSLLSPTKAMVANCNQPSPL